MDDASLALPAPPRAQPQSASSLLEDLYGAFPNEKVSVRELLDRLEGRAFGLLLLLLALPMCIPNIPGISTIFGVLMVAPALQMIFGNKTVWLPKRICAWEFKRENLQSAIRGALPIVTRIERYVRPRWSFLVRPPVTILLGLQTLLMAFVLVLPIPLGNLPPGITVVMTALALLQRDGLLALLSVPAAAISTFIAMVMAKAAWVALREVGLTVAAMLSGQWPF
jgi:hypothetical protein